MGLTRRQFIYLCSSAMMSVGLSQTYVSALAEAFSQAAKGDKPIVWLQGAGCNGCTASLLNSVHPAYRELLESVMNLQFHAHFAAGQERNLVTNLRQLAKNQSGKYILVVEGAIPTADNGRVHIVGQDDQGRPVSFRELVKELGASANAIISVGTCAAYGGMAAAKPNPTASVSINNFVSVKRLMNIPGCPPHPDWIVGAIGYLLLYGELPELDDFGRPKCFYGAVIHDNCPRRQYFDNNKFAQQLGEEGCLLQLGCKGPMAFGDCFNRRWNSGVNWCIGAQAPCISCTHPNFPDQVTPFYAKMPKVKLAGITTTADNVGKVALTATIITLGVHLSGNILAGRFGKKLNPQYKEETKEWLE